MRLAMNQNIGAGGMLIAMCADFKVGDLLSLTFRLPTGEGERSVKARVVRVEPNTDDPEGAWPYKVGLAFEEVAADLVPYLDDAQSRFGG